MHAVVDIGNTRIKWALLDHGRLEQPGSAVHRDALDAALAALDATLPRMLERVVVANVAGEAIAERLRELVGTRRGARVEFIATAAQRFGVRCAYAEPARLGVDRWVAVLAAYRAAAGAACVINAGTAVTFDAVDAGGRHLGGLILPGARLIAAALDRETSNIGATEPAGAAPAGLDLLGKSTDAAVGNGAMLALAAALDRAVGTVARALGTQPRVYLSGGGAAQLRGWLETSVELRADLVLEGLALFADEPKGSDA
jgi:type III pantothenate kinase